HRVLDLVVALHLADEQLRVGDNLDVAQLELGGLPQALDECAVLSDVVGGDADRLAVCGQHRSVLRLEDVGEGGWAWIPARPAVCVQASFHGPGGTSRFPRTPSPGRCAAGFPRAPPSVESLAFTRADRDRRPALRTDEPRGGRGRPRPVARRGRRSRAGTRTRA